MNQQEALLNTLAFHKGKENAIKGADLRSALAMMGFLFNDERELRELIHECRQQGELICSSAGSTPGYYLAASRSEFDEFSDRELLARIRDLAKTISAMRRAAGIKFGKQRGLGI